MKKILLLYIFSISTTYAQTIDCPKISKGKNLSGYSIFYDKQTEIQGGLRKVKGGYEVDLPLKFQYLVCEYGNIKNWQEVKLNQKIESCSLKVRESKNEVKEIRLICK